MPPELRERLGPEATVGLLSLLETSRKEWSEELMEVTVERFERRLTEEVRGLRHWLRSEIREGDAALRLEMRDMRVAITHEIAELGTTLRKEMGDQRTELFKWAFAFWLGQIVALTAILDAMLRR